MKENPELGAKVNKDWMRKQRVIMGLFCITQYMFNELAYVQFQEVKSNSNFLV